MPTRSAKSEAASPDRCQVSSNSSRCSGEKTRPRRRACTSSALTIRRPRRAFGRPGIVQVAGGGASITLRMRIYWTLCISGRRIRYDVAIDPTRIARIGDRQRIHTVTAHGIARVCVFRERACLGVRRVNRCLVRGHYQPLPRHPVAPQRGTPRPRPYRLHRYWDLPPRLDRSGTPPRWAPLAYPPSPRTAPRPHRSQEHSPLQPHPYRHGNQPTRANQATPNPATSSLLVYPPSLRTALRPHRSPNHSPLQPALSRHGHPSPGAVPLPVTLPFLGFPRSRSPTLTASVPHSWVTPFPARQPGSQEPHSSTKLSLSHSPTFRTGEQRASLVECVEEVLYRQWSPFGVRPH